MNCRRFALCCLLLVPATLWAGKLSAFEKP
jgi:hypothetical protein